MHAVRVSPNFEIWRADPKLPDQRGRPQLVRYARGLPQLNVAYQILFRTIYVYHCYPAWGLTNFHYL